MRILNDSGALTLMVTLILAAILIFENIFLVSAKEREIEWQLGQLTDQTGDWVLAAYDRDLLEQWGLYAYSATKVSNFKMSELSLPLAEIQDRFSLDIQFKDKLSSVDILERQILNYITPLYPKLLNELKTLLNAGQDLTGVPSDQEGLTGLLSRSDSVSQAASALNGLKDKWPEYAAGDHGASGVQDPDLTEEQEDLSVDLLKLIFQQEPAEVQTAALPALWQTGNLEQSIDKILQSLSQAETLLQAAQRISQYAFPVQLYSLWQSTCQLNGSDAAQSTSAKQKALSLRGQDLDKIADQYPLELEYLTSGMEQLSARKSAANLQVYTVRLLLNCLSLLKSEPEMQKLERMAEVARIMVLLVSLGEVQVPASAIKWLLFLIKANTQAYADWQELIAGKTVNLLIYQPEQKLAADYRLHLLPYLLIQSEDELLKRLYTVIHQRCPGEWFNQVDVTLNYQTAYGLKRGLQQSFSYISAPESS
ncbi:hypothetical protein HCH52_11955 [Oscillospiraceae bacterium HV4-5-C5C]|nr:hypothetical protein [Oscillospiraceae bacterium HV4-5-C5C]